MDLTFSEKESAFRDELREWLEGNRPGEPPEDAGDDAQYGWRRDWQRRLYEAGYLGLSWPKEYGGQGLTIIEAAIFNEEMARERAPAPLNELAAELRSSIAEVKVA